jgi:hypothetical protein
MVSGTAKLIKALNTDNKSIYKSIVLFTTRVKLRQAEVFSPENKSIAGLVEKVIVVNVEWHVSGNIGIVGQAEVDMLRKSNLMTKK